MDDKHINHYIRKQYNLGRENYRDSRYYGDNRQLQHELGKSLGLRQYYSTKMPMNGEIDYPLFNGESRFDNTIKQRYPTQNSLMRKKDMFFISRNDEF